MPHQNDITCSFEFDCLACDAAGQFIELGRAYTDSAEKNARIIRSRLQCAACGHQIVLGLEVHNAGAAENAGLEFTGVANNTSDSAELPGQQIAADPPVKKRPKP